MWMATLASGLEGPAGGLGGGALAIAIGYAAQWIIQRRTQKHTITRQDEDADVVMLRNIANDSLEREKLAYTRMAEIDKTVMSLDGLLRAERERCSAHEITITELKRRAENAERDNERFRGYIDSLERSLRSQGIQPPPQMD
jgi:hypothetical protein